MSDTSQKITHLLSGQIPDYVQEYYPMFVIFITKYFEFLENTSTGAQYTLQNIRLNRDIDTTAEDLARQFLNTYAPGLPNDSALDRTILVKHFKDFYAAKGSEQSFRFFFKAFFGDDIEIDYPRDYMFSTSDGKFYKETSVRVAANAGDPKNLVHTKIFGSSSGAYAVVNRVDQVTGVGGDNYYDLILQPLSWVGAFTSNETICGTYYNYANNTSGFVTTTSVTGVNIAAGRYLDSKGQLSNDQLLQDSLYYQQFSYVLRSRYDRSSWGDYVLKTLHPTGTIMFNEFLDDKISTNRNSSFVQTNLAETTVKIPTIKTYLPNPTYTFDRTADEYTGTSETLVANGVGFTTAAYTSIGAITYDGGYDYPGEHVTWSLMSTTDNFGFVTEVTRATGPSFDKLTKGVSFDDQLITWPYDVNSSQALVLRRYNSGFLNFTSIAITGGTTTMTAGQSFVTGVGVSFTAQLSTGDLITVGFSGITVTAYTVTNINSATSIRVNSDATQARVNVTSYILRLGSTRTTSLAANTLLISTSIGILTYAVSSFANVTSIGSALFMVTWSKNTRGNTIESTNAIHVSFSSTLTIIPYFDEDLQRNLSKVALGDSLPYNNSIYYHSSNSVVANNVISGVPLTANTTRSLTFKPYNWERGGTYDRAAILFKIDQPTQLNTSLTETFSTANITASGLIASWSSLTTSVSTTSFNSASSTGVYAFSSNCFVFNGTAGQSRFVGTTSFLNTQGLTVSLDYCVGDSYNGGEAPDTGEDLELQFTTSNGTTWATAAKLWTGGGAEWTLGNVLKSGQVYVSSGSTSIQGSDTLFLTDFTVGDRITIGSSLTTAYTITNIANNNLMTVSPAVVTDTSGIILSGADFTTALGTIAITSNGDGTWNFVGDSSVTSVLRSSGLTVLSGSIITVQARIRLNSTTTPALPFIVDYGDGPGTTLTLTQGAWTTTSFTVTGGPIGHLDIIGNIASGFNFDLDYVRINGQQYYYKPPVARQFLSTSITVYTGAAVSAQVRIIQIAATDANQDTYAIDNLTVTSTRQQPATGNIDISVSVSSNSTLNISDQDFFDITTIGTL